jgi:hypothetical protein
VYGWALPEDMGPLRAAIDRLAAGEVEVALFTSAHQVDNLFRVAADEVRSRLEERLVRKADEVAAAQRGRGNAEHATGLRQGQPVRIAGRRGGQNLLKSIRTSPTRSLYHFEREEFLRASSPCAGPRGGRERA